MQFTQVALALCLLALGLCEVNARGIRGYSRPTQECCLPRVFEGRISMIFAEHVYDKDIVLLGDCSFHLDTINGRLGSVQQLYVKGQKITLQIVERSDKEHMYVAIPHIKKCVKVPAIPLPKTKACLSKQVPFSRHHLGSSGSSLGVKVFKGPNELSTFTVTEDTCMPVLATAYVDQLEVKAAMSLTFYDMKEDIADNSVFDVPDYCNDQNGHVDESMDELVQSYLPHHRVRRALFDA